VKVVAVDGDVRKAVALDRQRAEVEQFPGLPGIPETDLLALRLRGDRHDLVLEPEREQDPRAVGADLNAGAHFFQLDRLLEHIDVKSLAEQRECRSQAANSPSHNRNLHFVIL